MKGKIFFSAIIFAGIAFPLGTYLKDKYIPMSNPGKNLPDINKLGSVDANIQQCKKLIELLRKEDWKPHNIPRHERHLLDESLWENQESLKDGVSPINYTRVGSKFIPEYQNVAFTSDLYVRLNSRIYKGDIVKRKPSGFYLVAWTSGEVTKAPVEDVRWVKSKNGQMIMAFPGMEGYTQDGLKDPSVQFANGGTQEEMAAYFHKLGAKSKSLSSDTCPDN